MTRLHRPALVASRLFEAAALLTATRVVLLASPRRVAATLLRRASSPVTDGAPTERALAVAAAVNRVAPWVGSTCLSRALAGWLMLRRRGVPAVVRVGAQRRNEIGVRMHAWLEVAGAPLIGVEEAADFVPLTRCS